MRKTLVLCFTLATCFTLSAALADTTGYPVLKTRVRTLAAFKNGLGFVYRVGETKLKDGSCVTGKIPPAALGTLWIGTTNVLSPVQEVVSFQDKAEWENNATSLGELIALNVGKDVAMTSSAVTGPIRGTILSVPKWQPVPEELRRSEPPSYSPPRVAAIGAEPQQVVMIRTSEGKVLAINQSTIQSVEFAGNPETKTKSTVDVPRAKITLGGKPNSADITMAYLEKGITWSPSYLVNIKNDKEAEVTLEAVLANDVEDMDDVDVSFVVGFPNYQFADNTTLLDLEQSIASFIQRLSNPNQRDSGSAGSWMSQSVMYNAASYSRERWDPTTSYSATKGMSGETNEDLYFYHQPNVTLKKGERARYTVLTAKSPYEHVYKWEVPDSMNVDDRGMRTDSSRNADTTDQVWHVLRIENKSTSPWTTAPAFVVNGSMPVAQDILAYTPTNARSTLRLTVATDVRAEQTQTEVSRTQEKILTSTFDRVSVDGKLMVKNWKTKPIKMNVAKSLVGEVGSVSDDGKITKVARKLTAVNSNSEIVWDFDLKPGEEKMLTYHYSVLIYR